LKTTPRGDRQLSEYLAQVIVDRAGADEELACDLGIGLTRGGKARDLALLWREIVRRFDRPVVCARAPVASSS
jgi:hypothetical protein